nr:MAG: helix-turn-helix domain protein [Bacteriophage sp.]
MCQQLFQKNTQIFFLVPLLHTIGNGVKIMIEVRYTKTNDEIIKPLNDLHNREGTSISELAHRVDMAKSSVSRYFNGTREFPLNYVDKFASALHTTPETLIGVSPVDPFKVKKLNVHSYPYIPADISAGILCNVDLLTSDDVETIQLPDGVMGRYAGDSSILMMHVNGESMNQTIPDGSLKSYVQTLIDVKS